LTTDKLHSLSRRPTYQELYTLVQEQAKTILLLKAEIETLKHPKNSRNSSLPPSKDENRPKPNQSLRKPSGKNSGGQLGREGKTLEMVSTPDKVVELQPDYCKACGTSLISTKAIKEQSRQIVDIPPIQAVFTEYQTFSKVCGCGCKTTADFPQCISAPVSYGANIEALIGYFHARQYLPFARMQEVFNDVFNIGISQGGIHYLLNRFADKTSPVYELIRQRVSNSDVVGADETGVKVNADKRWYWTWQTPKTINLV
jgi:transposase